MWIGPDGSSWADLPDELVIDETVGGLDRARRSRQPWSGAPTSVPASSGWTSSIAADGRQIWTVAGSHARSRVVEWMTRRSTSALGGDVLDTPVLHRWDPESALYDLARAFSNRVHVTQDGFVLRWNSDPGFFAWLCERGLDAADLPLRVWEIGPSFRRNRAGERRGQRRLDEFTLHDHHTVVGGLDAATREYARQLRIQVDLVGDLSAEHVVELVTRPEYCSTAEGLARAVAQHSGRPVRVEIEADSTAYWVVKHVVHVRGGYRTFNTQLDPTNAARFGIAARGAEPVHLLHTSFGSVERALLVLAHEAESTNGVLPAWVSHVQVCLVPVTGAHVEAAFHLAERLARRGVRAEVDDRRRGVGARTHQARARLVPHTIVLGDDEVAGDRYVLDGTGAPRAVGEIADELVSVPWAAATPGVAVGDESALVHCG